jgi:2-polyprenyl-3-methyl-5-hydroxy-6-metoxy-1,4-benzoquinol methylase
MESNWLQLWRELVAREGKPLPGEIANRYKSHKRTKTERHDDLLDFVLGRIGSEDTVLDIGAGTGRWTIPIARVANNVTALEPSADMLKILGENVDAAQLDNIQIKSCLWEKAVVNPHDIVVCAHALYLSADYSFFVRKMEQSSRKTCYLALRLPPCDGIISELSYSIYGCRHDSPNAIVAYNALYSMGIYVNILVEGGIKRWENDTLDEAFIRAKKHLYLNECSTYDKLIRDKLESRLSISNNRYIWPDGMRSALLWWNRPGDYCKKA